MITADDVRRLIRNHADSRPRSRQADIGISEIEHPCARRLVHKINGTEPSNPGDPLAAWIGSATHAQLAEALEFAGEGWATEVPVTIPPYNLRGTVDAWHPWDGIVLDWKVVGESTLRRVRSEGPGRQYRGQVHTYAMALDCFAPELSVARVPSSIQTVAIAFIPRSGRLANVHVWSEPYDEAVAEAALRRLEALRAVAPLGPALAPAVESYCSWCPYWLPGTTDLNKACPGVPAATRPATVAETLGNTTRRTA